VDIDAIRVQFIQDNLRRAIQEMDRERASRTAHAFRHYFEWFEDRFPDREKRLITEQLCALEKTLTLPHASAR
jgi:hypothetical protein